MKQWLISLKQSPAKWHRRSGTERLLLLEAFVLLGIARFFVLAIPFRWLAVTLGQHMKESAEEVAPRELRIAGLIGQAVCSAAANTPWESVCLPQAVAGKWMLQRRRISGTLYLGLAKKENGPERLAAHAWLRCGDNILTGTAGHQQFTVVSTFS
jgi:hypothetical protein